MGLNAEIFVGPDGLLRFIYDDELQSLQQLGAAVIIRASHVEPTRLGWEADLGPSGGPVLGPFPRRVEALQAEADWLNTDPMGISNFRSQISNG